MSWSRVWEEPTWMGDGCHPFQLFEQTAVLRERLRAGRSTPEIRHDLAKLTRRRWLEATVFEGLGTAALSTS